MRASVRERWVKKRVILYRRVESEGRSGKERVRKVRGEDVGVRGDE